LSCGIHVHDLKKSYRAKSYKTVEAVRGVSFDIGHGDVLGLIGPSGCGKTTIACAIAGLLTPDSGTAGVTGRLGFVSQDPYSSLCPVMRVCDIVAEPLVFRKQTKDAEVVRDALAQVGLDYDTLKNRLPHELSGGQRQRVAVARALVASGGVLILDEPVSMLDYDVKADIAAILRSLVDYAVLLISHDIGFVRDLATHIAVMDNGLIVESGAPEEICENPQNMLTKKLVLASLDLKAYLKSIEA